MTEQDVRKQMEESFVKVRPKVAQMTELMVECYQQGFKTCFKLLTGKD